MSTASPAIPAEAAGPSRQESPAAASGPSAAGWWRALGALAVVLALLLGRACERYVPRYQSLPVLDWLQASPPFDQAAAIPPAQDLANAMAGVEPRIPYYWEQYTEWNTTFLPGTSVVVRSMGGLRDTGTLRKESPAPPELKELPPSDQTSLWFFVLVFHSADQAAAWVDLRTLELDIGRAEYRYGAYRLTGPDQPDKLWVTRAVPGPTEPQAGHALMVARRGPVAVETRATETRLASRDPRDVPDLNVRAANLARTATSAWLAWLATQPYAQGW